MHKWINNKSNMSITALVSYLFAIKAQIEHLLLYELGKINVIYHYANN